MHFAVIHCYFTLVLKLSSKMSLHPMCPALGSLSGGRGSNIMNLWLHCKPTKNDKYKDFLTILCD